MQRPKLRRQRCQDPDGTGELPGPADGSVCDSDEALPVVAVLVGSLVSEGAPSNPALEPEPDAGGPLPVAEGVVPYGLVLGGASPTAGAGPPGLVGCPESDPERGDGDSVSMRRNGVNPPGT